LSNLRITEIKAFVPSKNFELSKQFYQDLGFTMDSDDDGIAYFHFENVSFLLQNYCVEALAENFMMHILVEDVDAWWGQVLNSGRRGFITSLASKGVSVRVLQELAGHRSLAVTQRYIEVNHQLMRNAVELV